MVLGGNMIGGGISGLVDHHHVGGEMPQADINDLLQQIMNITDQSLDEAQAR